MKAPRLVRGRACPVFAQLIVDGSVAVPKRATRRSYAMMLLQRGCRGFQRKARCGDPDVDGVFSPFDDCPTLKGYDDTAGCPVPGHTIATFPFRANQAETDPKIVAYRIKTTVKALRDNPKLGVVLVRGSAMKGESYRRRLALMRAQHVRRLLVSAGAAKHRLVVGAHDGSVTQVSVVVAAKSVPAKLTTEQMLSATKQLRALSRRCTDPATAAWGSSLVRYWINPDGRVTNVRVSGAAKGNATGMCLEKILRAYRYPRSKSGQPSSLSVRKGRGL